MKNDNRNETSKTNRMNKKQRVMNKTKAQRKRRRGHNMNLKRALRFWSLQVTKNPLLRTRLCIVWKEERHCLLVVWKKRKKRKEKRLREDCCVSVCDGTRFTERKDKKKT